MGTPDDAGETKSPVYLTKAGKRVGPFYAEFDITERELQDKCTFRDKDGHEWRATCWAGKPEAPQSPVGATFRRFGAQGVERDEGREPR